jgi:hypothetical protein
MILPPARFGNSVFNYINPARDPTEFAILRTIAAKALWRRRFRSRSASGKRPGRTQPRLPCGGSFGRFFRAN